MPNSLQHHRLYSPWNSPAQNTGVGSLRDLPNPRIEHRSLALQVNSLPAKPQGKPKFINNPTHFTSHIFLKLLSTLSPYHHYRKELSHHLSHDYCSRMSLSQVYTQVHGILSKCQLYVCCFFFPLSLEILQWNLTTYSINSSKKKFIHKLCFISLSIYTLHFTLSYFTWSCRFDPWVGNIRREGDGNPLQDSCLGNPMDRGAWRTAAQRVTNQLGRSWQLNHHHSGKKK